MLLNIKTGSRGIKQFPQKDLVYVKCKISDIINHCPEWCFTDGHAKNHLTMFYNHIDNLAKLDWNIISKQYWYNTEDDYDRMRRKQAEFLVKGHMPTNCICELIILTTKQVERVKAIQQQTGTNIPIYVDTERKYFFL